MPRATDWVDTVLAPASVPTGLSTNVRLDGALSQADLRGATLIRTIVSMSLSTGTVSGAWGLQMAHIGVAITGQEAFAAGVFPDPQTSADKPPRGWIYRNSAPVHQNGVGVPISTWLQADIRGARKIEAGVLYLIVDNVTVNGTSFSLVIRGLIRCLIKLP